MLQYISKKRLWACMDKGHHKTLGWTASNLHLKTWQDVVVYDQLAALKGKTMGEIGGGTSRLIGHLARNNTCLNIDRFDGSHGGPTAAPQIPGVRTVVAYLGDFSPDLASESLDVIYSVSVLEHVPFDLEAPFFDDMVRVLKPGGLSLHAIDIYVGDKPLPHSQKRMNLYRSWLDHLDIEPLGPIDTEDVVFRSWMCSNPDQTMWNWNSAAPHLAPQRGQTQSTSLLFGFRKKA